MKEEFETPRVILCLGEMMPSGACAYRIKRNECYLLSKMGWKVLFVTPDLFPRLRAKREWDSNNFLRIFTPGFAPIRFRRGGFGLLDLLFKSWLALTTNYDVLHVSCGHRPAQFVPALIARYRGKPTVDEWWEWYGKGGRAETRSNGIAQLIALYDKTFELSLKKFFTHIVAISKALIDRIPHHPSVSCLNGGIESHVINMAAQSESKSRPKDFRETSLVLGMVSLGRSEETDLEPVFCALDLCVESGIDFQLFLTGESDYINECILSRYPEETVIYKGWLTVNEYTNFLKACDAFILPLANTPINRGRWPHKFGDYMAFRKYIIVNTVGDLEDALRSYPLGIVCKHEDKSFLSAIKKVDKLISSQEHDLFNNQLNLDKFSVKSRVDKLDSLYKSFLY